MGIFEINDKKYGCGAAAGYANPETGKIVAFSNIQNIIDRKIIEDNIEFILRVAVNWPAGEFIKIVGFFTDTDNKKTLSSRGRIAIEIAINK